MAKRPPKARQRRPYIRSYKIRAAPLDFGDEKFRLTLKRFGVPDYLVDEDVTQISWTDDSITGQALTGSLSLARLAGHRIGDGDTFRLEVARGPGRAYKGLWQMRVNEPKYDAATQIWELGLTSSIFALRFSKEDWRFVKDKRHPHGWKVTDIIRAVCRRAHVPLGHIPKTSHRIKKLVKKKASAMDVILAALRDWKDETGVKLIVTERRGVLDITTPKRRAYLTEFKDHITAATVDYSLSGSFATVLIARASVDKGKGKKKRKITTTVRSRAGIRRFGYVRRVESFKAKTLQSLRKKATVKLKKLLEQKKEFDFTHPGIPETKPGDAVEIRLPHTQVKQTCYVRTVTHTVAPGAYDMQVTMRIDDPWVDLTKVKFTKKMCQKAKKRKRKLPAECKKHHVTYAKGRLTPPKGNQRSNSDKSSRGSSSGRQSRKTTPKASR